ncbi:MAG: hypothetical protein JWP75_1183 [Frondihabitans sp.]|nr:hypothetical protein [Frondihabitans sp.]
MAPTPSRTTGPSLSGDGPGSRPATPRGGDTALDIRYGRTRSYRIRRRTIAIAAGAIIVVVFIAWVVWAGLDGTSATVDTEDAGYVIKSDHLATVTSEVSVDPGTKVDCAVEVLNEGFDIVGWKVIHLAPSTLSSNTYTTTLNTMNRGVTGLIDKCWLP